MKDIPFVAFSNDELEEKEPIGELATCPNCKQLHQVIYGEEILQDGTRIPSKLLGAVECPKDKCSYLVSVAGKRI